MSAWIGRNLLLRLFCFAQQWFALISLTWIQISGTWAQLWRTSLVIPLLLRMQKDDVRWLGGENVRWECMWYLTRQQKSSYVVEKCFTMQKTNNYNFQAAWQSCFQTRRKYQKKIPKQTPAKWNVSPTSEATSPQKKIKSVTFKDVHQPNTATSERSTKTETTSKQAMAGGGRR